MGCWSLNGGTCRRDYWIDGVLEASRSTCLLWKSVKMEANRKASWPVATSRNLKHYCHLVSGIITFVFVENVISSSLLIKQKNFPRGKPNITDRVPTAQTPVFRQFMGQFSGLCLLPPLHGRRVAPIRVKFGVEETTLHANFIHRFSGGCGFLNCKFNETWGI